VNLLLDTHVVLWWLADDPSLDDAVRHAISDPDNTVFLSAVVVWEIRIKQMIGKLDLPPEFADVLADQDFVELPVTVVHALAVGELPPIHRDPFDRMLVAQAKVEGLTLVTRDSALGEYGVAVL
jgi:PIN domain nuclease of toxin-antitoxin system